VKQRLVARLRGDLSDSVTHGSSAHHAHRLDLHHSQPPCEQTRLFLAALLQKSRHPFPLLRRVEEERLSEALDGRRVAAAPDRVERHLGYLKRERSVGCDRAGQLPRRGERVPRLAEPLKNAEREASSASRMRPVNTRSFARPSPTNRGRR